ncbi:D-alanyl-D-alanine carboxypeptidase [Streptomyces sp. TLI_053]|uniref:serine hydrolase domain-containing protein n=1 Tax=Streptomyces sp. TLI_053 TaxID=1855352 RepID=UPI000879E36A|nr:serine hydrolase domain-containing protein [Streptomyces sp. TLI_053]SDT47844.1 D-alanyl-D-alanine carboxypeptidase [Streptomyces sp. TLI_053]
MARHSALRRGLGAMAMATAVTAGTVTSAAAAGGHGSHGSHSATRTAMTELLRDEILPGTIAGVREDGGNWSAAVGVADGTTGRPRSPQERFRIGSLTKTFTATVVLQLKAEGRLGLDDPVERWLPGVVQGNGNDGSTITVRHLLGHTSGLFSYDEDPLMIQRLASPDFLKHRYDTYRPEDLVRTAVSHPPLFAPGSSRSYSNTNFVLAGMIVAKVTGHPYGQEIEQRILRPLGLRATSLPGTAAGLPRPHAVGYSTLFGGSATPVETTELNPSWGGAAGEMISTTADLNRFYSALMQGRLLPQAEMDEMVPAAGGPGLGIGSVKLSCGVTAWGHTGGIHGSSTVALTTRDGRHTASFNTNADWASGERKLAEAEFCG